MKSLAQATAEAARQGYTFEEVVAMPEGDDWEYSNGKNYVCACFVARFYKAGGLFDGYDILANEFTPKDVVQLDFFDKDYKDKRPPVTGRDTRLFPPRKAICLPS